MIASLRVDYSIERDKHVHKAVWYRQVGSGWFRHAGNQFQAGHPPHLGDAALNAAGGRPPRTGGVGQAGRPPRTGGRHAADPPGCG